MRRLVVLAPLVVGCAQLLELDDAVVTRPEAPNGPIVLVLEASVDARDADLDARDGASDTRDGASDTRDGAD